MYFSNNNPLKDLLNSWKINNFALNNKYNKM